MLNFFFIHPGWLTKSWFNPLVPDAHYSERQDEPFSLQLQQLEIDLKLKCRFLFFCNLGTNGLRSFIYLFI